MVDNINFDNYLAANDNQFCVQKNNRNDMLSIANEGQSIISVNSFSLNNIYHHHFVCDNLSLVRITLSVSNITTLLYMAGLQTTSRELAFRQERGQHLNPT